MKNNKRGEYLKIPKVKYHISKSISNEELTKRLDKVFSILFEAIYENEQKNKEN